MQITIKYKNEVISLNPEFIAWRKASQKTVDKAIETHKKRIKIFHKMKKIDPVLENDKLRKLNKKVVRLDRKLQKLWGFQKNDLYLSWWYRVPHCSCDKNLNQQNLGRKMFINPNCLVHGGEKKI